MNKIGRKIRSLREQRGYSQEIMAKELGISQPSYARLEQKDDRISVTRLQKIARILDVPAVQFLNDSNEIANTASAFGLENMNQDIVNLFLQSQFEHVQTLRKEVESLRNMWVNSQDKSR